MTNVILREQLKIQDEPQELRLFGGKILHLQEDRQGLGRIDIWFETPTVPTNQALPRFRSVGTGHEFENGWNHVATVVMSSGLVWHVYREFVWQIG